MVLLLLAFEIIALFELRPSTLNPKTATDVVTVLVIAMVSGSLGLQAEFQRVEALSFRVSGEKLGFRV